MISPIVHLLEKSPPLPPYPLLWISYQCTSPKNFPLELTKPEATRDAFWYKLFFITVHLIIFDNWIIKLLLKITCNLIKKNVHDYVNCDSFKNNYLILSYPINFSEISCDVKLKPILIDWSAFTSLGSGFMHFPDHFLSIS